MGIHPLSRGSRRAVLSPPNALDLVAAVSTE